MLITIIYFKIIDTNLFRFLRDYRQEYMHQVTVYKTTPKIVLNRCSLNTLKLKARKLSPV